MKIAQEMLSNGSIIDGTYQIICRIGEVEGMLVYRARHLKKQCDVLMRQLGGMDDTYIDVALVDALREFSNVHLPIIYDVVASNGAIYSIEEEIKGISLDEYVRQNGRLSYSETYRLSVQLADALIYLHQQEKPLIHANVLPQNIMIDTASGNLYLINMDLARAVGLTDYQSWSGICSGYLAPEQYLIKYENQAVSLTPATDVYCMGCVMYYMVTGYAPDARYDRIIPVSDLGLDVEAGFQKIIEKMMSYQPNDRYGDAQKLLEAIYGCYKLDKRYRRLKRLCSVNIIIAACLMLVGAGVFAGGIQKNKMDALSDYNSRLCIADEYVLEEKFYDARDVIMDMEDDFPGSLELYEREIECMYLSKDYEDCIDRALAIIKNDFPKEFGEEEYCTLGDFYHILAQGYYRIEKYDDAQEYIEKAVDYYDKSYEYYRDYCLILVAQEKIDKAEGELGVSKELAWDEAELIYVEAKIADALENYSEATERYLQVIDHAVNEEIVQDALTNCAAAYDNMSDYRNEIDILERAIAAYPENEFYQIQLAKSYMSWGDDEEYSAEEYYGQALRMYQMLSEKYPDAFDIQDNVVILLTKLGENERAETLLRDMTETFRDEYRVYMWLSYIEDEKQSRLKKKERDYGQMEKYYDKAKKLYSSSMKDYYMEDLEERMTDLKEEGWFK